MAIHVLVAYHYWYRKICIYIFWRTNRDASINMRHIHVAKVRGLVYKCLLYRPFFKSTLTVILLWTFDKFYNWIFMWVCYPQIYQQQKKVYSDFIWKKEKKSFAGFDVKLLIWNWTVQVEILNLFWMAWNQFCFNKITSFTFSLLSMSMCLCFWFFFFHSTSVIVNQLITLVRFNSFRIWISADCVKHVC